MAIRLVNLGRADKGDGDPLRVAFNKINENFSENFESIDNLNTLSTTVSNLSSSLTSLNNDLDQLTSVVDSIPNTGTLTFDFGSIVPKQVFSPIELLFYASSIDMGSIISPTPVLYDAGTLG